jgi:hypothetical protein
MKTTIAYYVVTNNFICSKNIIWYNCITFTSNSALQCEDMNYQYIGSWPLNVIIWLMWFNLPRLAEINLFCYYRYLILLLSVIIWLVLSLDKRPVVFCLPKIFVTFFVLGVTAENECAKKNFRWRLRPKPRPNCFTKITIF